MFKSNRGNKFGGKKFGGNKFGKKSFGDRGGRTFLHKAVCDECGKPCEVPFKPSGDRPVYCNNCFKKNENGDSRRPQRDSDKSYDRGGKNDQYQEQFAILNDKLDQILEALTNIAEDGEDDEEA